MRRGLLLKIVALIVGVGILIVLGIWAYIQYDAGPDTASKDIQDVAPTLPFSNLPDQILFRIEPSESEARFRVNEILMGEDLEVVGTTQDVAGDVLIDAQNPAESTVGTIAINARTLRTPVDQRNDSIRSQILETREHEFIFFYPAELLNISTEPVLVGETVSFQVQGDLEIKDVKQSVIFDVTLNVVSETQITGFGSATIKYEDWGIEISPPPTVAGIEDTVIVEIEFVARQVVEEMPEDGATPLSETSPE